MTHQGHSPDPETQSKVVRQPSNSRSFGVSLSLSSKARTQHEGNWRRRYGAVLSVALGCSVAAALIVGVIEGIQNYHSLHIGEPQPLSAQTAGKVPKSCPHIVRALLRDHI